MNKDIVEGDSEYIGATGTLSIDEAKKLKKVAGSRGDEFEKDILELQDNLFKDIMCVVFGWKLQPDGTKKLVSKLPNGKIIFPDRSEDLTNLEAGVPYICLVYEREREAFAKICAEEYQPKIFIPSSRIPTMVWKDKSGNPIVKMPFGNNYESRIIEALKEMEEMGFPSIRVVFRKNQKV